MDKNHGKGLRSFSIAALAATVLLSQTTAFGVIYSCFGTTVAKSFGPPEQKEVWVEIPIFIPIDGPIADLNLSLNMEHTSFCDLLIIIEHPSGIASVISSYDEYDFIAGKICRGWFTLDQQSKQTVNNAAILSNSSYKPNAIDGLNLFNGMDAYGLWKIKLCDAVYYDTGLVSAVRLDIATRSTVMFLIPEPSSFLLILLAVSNLKIRL